MSIKKVGSILIAGALLGIVSYAIYIKDSGREMNHLEANSQSGEDASRVYTCPMHPEIVQHEPGSCPICGMDLTLVEKTEGKNVDGRAPVRISHQKQEISGIKSTKAQIQNVTMKVRAYGEVVYDPELYSAQQDYLSTYHSFQSQGSSMKSALRAVGRRLELLGMSAGQIKALAKRGRVDDRLLYGTQKGKALVYGQIYESDIEHIKIGHKAVATSSAYPGIVFDGLVLSMDLALNKRTRTLRAHLEIQDPDHRLKPGMFLNLQFENPLGDSLVIPDTAVLYTGNNALVFVASESGRFEPKQIQVGYRGEGWTQVISGLKVGEKVVHHGTFLIDSESQLQATAGSAFFSGAEAHDHQN